jgi:hypothetical protein
MVLNQFAIGAPHIVFNNTGFNIHAPNGITINMLDMVIVSGHFCEKWLV